MKDEFKAITSHIITILFIVVTGSLIGRLIYDFIYGYDKVIYTIYVIATAAFLAMNVYVAITELKDNKPGIPEPFTLGEAFYFGLVVISAISVIRTVGKMIGI